MNRQEKETLVAELKEQMSAAQATFLINYKGLNVATLQGLRRGVRSGGGTIKVTKASLMRIAAQELEGSEEFASNFKQQVGLVFARGDVAAVAKQLMDFSKTNKSLQVVAGFFENRLLNNQQLVFLATLPSREVLIGQLAGTLQAPISALARVLQANIAGLAYVLKAVEEKKQQST